MAKCLGCVPHSFRIQSSFTLFYSRFVVHFKTFKWNNHIECIIRFLGARLNTPHPWLLQWFDRWMNISPLPKSTNSEMFFSRRSVELQHSSYRTMRTSSRVSTLRAWPLLFCTPPTYKSLSFLNLSSADIIMSRERLGIVVYQNIESSPHSYLAFCTQGMIFFVKSLTKMEHFSL